MGIYIQDTKIGYVYSSQEALPGGYLFAQKSTMKLSLMGSEETFATNMTAKTDSTLGLEEFTFDIASRQHTFYAEGRREGSKLKIKVESAGRTTTRDIALKDGLIILPALGHWVWAQSPEPGESWQVTVFEPTILNTTQARVKALAQDTILIADGTRVPAMKFETSMLGLTSEVWLDSTGTSIREEQQPGIVMIREPRAKALEAVSDEAKLDLLSFFAVRPDSLITSPRTIKELRLKVEGLEASDSLIISSSTQKVTRLARGVELAITSPDTALLKRSVIPLTRPAEFLESSVYIQSDDEAVKNTAARIVGSDRDAASAGTKLVKWVYANLKKRATASVPSAVEVLNTLEGDCNEHAILLAALARSVGIPTKINVGLVYLEGAFYYHAWNSFYIGGSWVPVDATFGQFPADPTHVQLHEGELDEQARVLSVVGKIKIAILSYR